MTASELREQLSRAPLTIHLVSGRDFYVPHSEFAVMGPREKFVVVFDHKEPAGFDLIDLKAIASVGFRRRKRVVS